MPPFERKHHGAKSIEGIRLHGNSKNRAQVREVLLKNSEHSIEWKTYFEIYGKNDKYALTELVFFLEKNIRFSILNVPDSVHKRMLKRVLKFEKLRPEARVPVRPSEKKRAANLKRALYNHREKRAAEKKKNERL